MDLFFIITRSREQYEESNLTDEIRKKNDDGSIVVFDDMLDFNQKAIDPFFYDRTS